ncbi:glycosyltransferase family 2 protein [Comamonas sp. JUb58]|uniref:glycosyltransferase family 2 protein n=1 Tax=Comamonas sp. JUb58 TaxID=2485114 RepID=UPI0010611F0D|nr:glycosyltransferase family 2 protein [Comamonas sp. JUb58]TDS82498.1 glycosyl transferase family 2 [Comamonas sp. JUb58]
MSSTPLLSVVIPTHNRAHLLTRSVQSALASAPSEDVEVIIVPNGYDEKWKQAAEFFRKQPRVSWHPIETANACTARNAGMHRACGKYLRFLDDDDYLLPAALDQLLEADLYSTDVSQGCINWVTESNQIFRQQAPKDSSDFVESILDPNIFSLSHSFLWLREKRVKFPWNPNLIIGDDLEFALNPFCLGAKLRVHHFKHPVGAWVHHNAPRLSTSQDYLLINQKLTEVLLHAYNNIKTAEQLTPKINKAFTDRLWEMAHTQFPQAPIYWHKIIKQILAISPDSIPPDSSFKRFPLKSMPPLLIEWMMFPHRKLLRKHQQPDRKT